MDWLQSGDERRTEPFRRLPGQAEPGLFTIRDPGGWDELVVHLRGHSGLEPKKIGDLWELIKGKLLYIT